MASIEVKLPDIGEGVTEGEIVRWLVKEGDAIKHDQPLVEVMTDKATVEIPCSTDGKVTKLLAKEGQVVKIGAPLLALETGASAGASAPSPTTSAQPTAPQKPTSSTPSSSAPMQSGNGPQKSNVTPMTAAPSYGATAVPQAPATTYGGAGMDVYPPVPGANVLATPATRRYAREAGVDLNNIPGTGPAGRVTRDDVMKVTQGVGAVAAARPQMAPQGGEERKPFRGIRKKIAENLVRSKQIIPHFTHADEVDVTALVEWRKSMKDVAEQRGVKLTYLPFIMKALMVTCREFPQFNASIDDAAGEIVYKHYFNIGFAADTPEGLLVPVVKNVEGKSILEIGHDIIVLAEKARAGKLAPDDMKHGTVTITNIGSVGGVYATPIINHPEVAIFGVYEIQKKPVVIDDQIVIREMMNVTATCDHRLVDGAAAARFLKRLKTRLSNPGSLILEMI